MDLREFIKQPTFTSAAQETILNLMVTNSWIVGELTAAMAPYDVTPVQYNVLRILRGSHPVKLTCSQVGERMLDRTPDVTRLLDRLDRASLIDRARAEHDRRVVEVGITPKGIALLDRMKKDVKAVQERLTRHLSDAELREMSEMLDTLRTDQ
ncbi:MAG: MarR family transcriptional regulator [Rhodothermales bacterium]